MLCCAVLYWAALMCDHPVVLLWLLLSCAVLQSLGEARLLLRDWLVIFTTNYHRNSYMRASAAQLVKLPVRAQQGSGGGEACMRGSGSRQCGQGGRH